MISLETYELHYDMFLAEQELYSNLFALGAGVVSESVGLIAVNEGFKETVLKYLEKVAAGIQKAWDKFKEILTRGVDVTFLKAIEKKVKSVENPGFVMNNYKTYKFDALGTVNLTPFNYEEMKDVLDKKEDFLRKYYSSIPTDSSIADYFEKQCVASVQDVRCTKEKLLEMYNKCLTGYKALMDKIEADLKTVNGSTKAIQTIVSQMQNTQTATEAAIIYEQYIIEEEQKKDEKLEFKDDPNRTSGGGDKAVIKAVSTYMGISTEILSAKMVVLKNAYNQDMKSIKHFINPSKAEKSEKKETEESSGGDVKAQVTI